MSTEPRDATPAGNQPRVAPVSLDDWFMLALAVVSVAMLSWITFWDVDDVWTQRVIVADYVVCAIFFIEFVVRWRRSGLGWRFPLRYWYEILGMIPVTSPALRGFRLIRIVVVVARLARATNRAFGDRAAAYIVKRFSQPIVSMIRRPVTVAVLDEVIAVAQAGRFADHLGAAIDQNRDELDAMIVELIREDQAAGRLRFMPFHDDVVRLISDTVFRITRGALSDPRVHELISDMISESADQLRQSVRDKEVEAARRDAGNQVS